MIYIVYAFCLCHDAESYFQSKLGDLDQMNDPYDVSWTQKCMEISSLQSLRTSSEAVINGMLLAGANLTNAVVDRVDFTRANLKNAKFHNAVITGVVFKDADLSGASFDEALIGNEDAKRM